MINASIHVHYPGHDPEEATEVWSGQTAAVPNAGNTVEIRPGRMTMFPDTPPPYELIEVTGVHWVFWDDINPAFNHVMITGKVVESE